MANLSKMRRDRLIAYIERLKQEHTDDESIMLFNELENALTEKRYGLVFEEHSEEVDEMLVNHVPVLTADPERRLCKNPMLPWNFIIQGDNLQALYLLEKTHKGKVDCIYIDPPYNTGAKDWKYNNDYVVKEDDYRHSKWLSMMKSRLELAKKLLNPENSVLIATIDEKEFLHLGCLLEEIFPTANIQMLSITMNHAGTGRKSDFARVNEFAFYVRLGSAEILPEYQYGEGHTSVLWDVLRRSELSNTWDKTKSQFYPIFINDKTGKIHSVGEPLIFGVDKMEDVVVPAGCTAVFPIRDDGIKTMWGCRREELIRRAEKGYIRVGKKTPDKPQKYSLSYIKTGAIADIESGKAVIEGRGKDGSVQAFYHDKRKKNPPTVVESPLYDARIHGSGIIDMIIGRERFSFPKSLYAVVDCLKFVIANKPNAIVVDFFAGSGTTMHAVNLLNAQDGGNRTCIMVTNNEISAAEEKEFEKRDIQKGAPEWEARGIAKYVTWPRTVCSIMGQDINGAPLKDKYADCGIPMANGFDANVKFFECSWVPRISDDSLAEQLMEHISEMIELQYGIEVDGKRIVLILSEEDADIIEKQWETYTELTQLYVSRGVLLTTKQNELFNTVEMHAIPDYYFDIELKEVGEAW